MKRVTWPLTWWQERKTKKRKKKNRYHIKVDKIETRKALDFWKKTTNFNMNSSQDSKTLKFKRMNWK